MKRKLMLMLLWGLTLELSGGEAVRLNEMLDTYGELCALASFEAVSRALALR